MACCKRKAGAALEPADGSNKKLKPTNHYRASKWCTCCHRPHTNDETTEMKRGAEGNWYCTTCWSEWWSLREDNTVPSVCRVLPKWCERHEEAFHISFPEESALPIAQFAVPAGSIAKAVELFFKHGFVIMRGVLNPDAAKEVLTACRGVRDATCRADPEGLGNRGRGRYSLSHVTNPGDCSHFSAFAKHLVDNAHVLDTFDAIYEEAGKRRICKSSFVGSKDVDFNGNQDTEQGYIITGTGGDFCQGWTSEFQPLHSDYGRARPLRPPSWGHEDFPVHDKEMPPVITANFVVQHLHRWNGAMRLVPWPEMAAYVEEVAKMGKPIAESNAKSPHFVEDKQTYIWPSGELHPGQVDIELAPDLGQELAQRPSWLGYKIFPLEAGDVLIRDPRIWHGGCPNLSSETRYLPAVEASSKEIQRFFQGRRKTYPKRALPGEFMELMSERAQKLCADLATEKNDGFLSLGLDDFSWVNWNIGAPAKRNHFMCGIQLQHDQIEAISLRACLEQITKNGKLYDAEQVAILKTHLTKLSPSHSTARLADSLKSTAHELLTLLAKKDGPARHVFARDAVSCNDAVSSTLDSEIAIRVSMILASI